MVENSIGQRLLQVWAKVNLGAARAEERPLHAELWGRVAKVTGMRWKMCSDGDGTEIAFVSDRDGDTHGEVYVIRIK